MQPKCLITGCDLYAPDALQFVHGDLFELGSVFIFNAVTQAGGHTAWDSEIDNLDDRFIQIEFFASDHFERRGVFVIPKEHAQVSLAAAEYMRMWGER